MAKSIPQKPTQGASQPSISARKTKNSYRVEKLNQYEYQAFRATRQDDGSYVEEPFGKCTLFHLVVQRIFEAMNAEANEVFQLKKKMAHEAV